MLDIIPCRDAEAVGRIADHELDRPVWNIRQGFEAIGDRHDMRGRAPAGATAARAEECASPFLPTGSSRYARRCDGSGSASWNRARDGEPRYLSFAIRVNLFEVLQQDAAPLKVQAAILAPGLQLSVDALLDTGLGTPIISVF